MPALATLMVFYVGVSGPNSARVDRQVHSLLDLGGGDLTSAHLSKSEQHKLASHGSGAREIVRGLHGDGVIAGELIDDDGTTLRLVVYNGDGAMLDFIELPLDTHALAKGDVESLRETVLPDLKRIARSKPAPEPEIEVDDPPAADDPPAPVADADDETAAADDDDDTVSADDIDAEIAAQGADIPDGDDDTPAPLRIRASAGVSLLTRTFAGPSSIASYSSVPVAGARIAAEVIPEPHVALTVEGEHTVAMSSMVHGAATSTEIEHWQARGALCKPMGGLDLEALLGVGRRTFKMDSHDPGRSPDGDYAYALVGARIGAKVGDRVTLHGLAAFEPVLAGTEPTMATFGPARRWALEVGGDVEVMATSHVYVDGAAGYQRFTWSWDMAGARGAGGAVDQYPSASISVGARY